MVDIVEVEVEEVVVVVVVVVIVVVDSHCNIASIVNGNTSNKTL